jgi:hypothetical protein
MAYIGRQLVRGQNRVLDDISSSFNGSTTAFNLTVSSSSSPPASVNQLWIILGGVIQKPGTDFTVADAVITFTTAPASTLSFWGMIQGDTSDINSPADASVTPSKIANSGDFAFPADVRFKDADASHYVGLQAPSTVSSNLVWTLPAADGSANQVLKTDGSGALGWASDANAPEGTAVLSTGETGTTKYLRVDGDNTCSWQLAVDATKMPLAGGTFTGDVTFTGDSSNGLWDKSANAFVANLTGTASGNAVLTGSTNNTITTVTGADAIQGEANLTFDGNNLTQTIDADGEGIVITGGSSNIKAMLTGNTNRSSANNTIFGVSGKWNSTEVGRIAFEAGADTTNKDDGHINFYTTPSGGSLTSRFDIQADGNVKIADGDLVIGTSGHGIDFSANSHAGGMTSETLDAYEEGTFTPTYVFHSSTGTFGYSTQTGTYTKIGNRVFFSVVIIASSHSGTSTGNLMLAGLPYAVPSTTPIPGSCFFIIGGNFTTDYGVALQTNQSERIEFYRQVQSTGANYSPVDASEVSLGSLYIKCQGQYLT